MNLKESLRNALDMLRQSVITEGEHCIVDYKRFIWQLNGIDLLLCGISGTEDMRKEVAALIDEIRLLPTK